jgi:hypothetical protein
MNLQSFLLRLVITISPELVALFGVDLFRSSSSYLGVSDHTAYEQ